MQSDAAQHPTNRKLTVFEAAEVLGISPEAVRARIKRGTLPKEKGPDGTVYVRLDAIPPRPDGDGTANQSRWDADGTTDQSPPDAPVVEAMQDQIDTLKRELEDWKEEARRKDAIIMTMAQRIPELEPAGEAPPEPREEPETSSPEMEGVEIPLAAEKPVSWWRRIFGA